MVALNPEDRKQLLCLLENLPEMAAERSRRQLLNDAELGATANRIDVSGSPAAAAKEIVDLLCRCGRRKRDREPLGSFLLAVRELVGIEGQKFLDRLLADYRLLEPLPLEEERKRQWVRGTAIGDLQVYQSHLAPPTEVGELGPNPYKGLLAFQETDGDRFFGREKQVAYLWETLRGFYASASEMRLLPIYGPSGSGKSSLARAGLIPELGQRPLPGYDKARVAVLVPGTHPLEALAAILARMATNDPAPAAKTREFGEELQRRNEEGVCDGLRRIADLLPDIAISPLIVLVDQFEEIYTLCESKKERDAFVENLLVAAGDRAKRVTVAITLRSDFLGETQKHPVLNRLLSAPGPGYLVPAMDAAELREAIAKPAEMAGGSLDEATIDRLVRETEGRDGALPLLQFALARIWEGFVAGKEPTATLQEIGGVGGALAGEAQRIYEGLDAAERETARRIFVGLVQLGEGVRDTRRRVAIADLASHREEPERVKRAIARFAEPGVRLVTLSSKGEVETAEVTHEALFERWELLREWLDEGREDIRFQRRLEEAAREWDRRDRAEGLLWRSPLLDSLQEFAKRRKEDLTVLQIAFFETSKQFARAGRIRLAISVAFLVGSLGFVALQWRQAEQREINDQITSLRREAEAFRKDGSFEIEALMKGLKTLQQVEVAVEEEQIDPETKMRAAVALWEIVHNIRERNRLEGHSAFVSHVTYSPDGSSLASSSDDKTIRLWRKDGTPIAILQGHSAPVKYVTYSPDGNTLASSGEDKTVRLWRKDGTPIATLQGHSAPVKHVTYSPDGNTLASSSDDKTIRLWRKDGTPIAILQGHSSWIGYVTYSPDGNTLASASDDNTVRLWNKDGTPIAILQGHSAPVKHVTYSPDGNTLASASEDNTIRLWNKDGIPIATLQGHSDWVRHVIYSPDGNILASASDDNTVRLWRKDGTPINTLQEHSARVNYVDYSSDGNTFISASDDKTLRLWRKDGTLIATFQGHSDRVLHATYNPEDNTLASASSDNTIRLWHASSAHIDILQGHVAPIWHLTYSPDGNTLASASQDNTVRLWHKNGTLIATLQGHSARVWHVAYSPDSNTLASASDDNTVRLWHKDGTSFDVLQKHTAPVRHVTYSPDGSTLASASEDNTVCLWRKDGTLITTLQGHSDRVLHVTYSPDGSTLASASEDNTVRLWRKDGTPIATLQGHSARVKRVIYSPDGNTLASASIDNTVRLWRKDGIPIATLQGHSAHVLHVTYSPDGNTLASASDDNTVRLWRKDGTPIATLQGHSNRVQHVTYSPDGNILASASRDNTVRLWRKDGTPIAVLQGHSSWVRQVTYSPDGNTLASASQDDIVRLWKFDLKVLKQQGCELLADYLLSHPGKLNDLKICHLIVIAWKGREYAKDGKTEKAIAFFQQALKLDPTIDLNPNTEKIDSQPEIVVREIAAQSKIKQGFQLINNGNVQEVIALFQQALELYPTVDLNPETKEIDNNPEIVVKEIVALERLKEGKRLIRTGEVEKAILAYEKVQQFAPNFITASNWATLCFYGSLHGYALEVMFACDKAIQFEPRNILWIASRGVAKARLKDWQGAISDFEKFLMETENKTEKFTKPRAYITRWLGFLKDGEDPFTTEEIQKVLDNY